MRVRPSACFAGLAILAAAYGTTALGPAALHPAHAADPLRPNIVYILSDDLGYGDLGCYGQRKIATPHIDRLAAEGMRFTDHYSGSSVCAPARCVLITGLHTGHCYVRDNRPLPFEGNVPIPAASQTIGKLLKQAGYVTACIGKWGLGYPGSEGDPLNQGFDHFFGYNCQREAHSYYPDHLWRNRKKVALEGNRGNQQKQYSHDLLTAEALQFIRDNRGRRFFLYLPYTIPHTKFEVPDLGPYADKPWTTSQKTQAAMIGRMDRDVGRVMSLLKELQLDRQTLVMFASDNGAHGGGGTLEHFNASGPLRNKKGSFYEGGIRVPLVVRWPGRIEAGAVSGHVSGFQDMLPTLAELAGAEVTGRTDGISLLPTLLGSDGQRQHEFLYWERGAGAAVRIGNWKVVRPKGKRGQAGPLELYDLQRDLGETTDVAAKHADVVARARKILEASHEHSGWFDVKFNGPNAKRAAEPKKRRKQKAS